MATLRQIARVCRVSPMTVSHVLNNTPGQVSEETRSRVLQAVREMDYRPRAAASHHEASVRTLGIALAGDANTFTGAGYQNAVLQSILNATQSAGLNLLLYHSSLFHTDTHRTVRTYLDGQCDGLVVLSPMRDAPILSVLQERGTPFVVIGDQPEASGIAYVDVDNFGDARVATHYLAQLGHRRIAFIGGPDFVGCTHRRRAGYQAALADANLVYDANLDLSGLIGEGAVYQEVMRLMQQRDIPLPTAFLGWNDVATLRALTALQDLRRRVPEQVSLVGFDDAPPATTATPPLTTMRQPYREIGAAAVEILIGLITGKEKEAKRLALPGKLIVRDSTMPPP